MTNYCTNCGAMLTESVERCGNCGTPNPNFNVEATKNANGYDPNSSPLIINNEGKLHMSGFASWAKGLAIVGIVGSVLGIIGMMFSLVGFAAGSRYMNGEVMGVVAIVLIICAILCGFSLYMCIRALQGANHFKNALRNGDANEVAMGFKDFHFYVKAAGIMLIVAIVLYFLLMIIAVASAPSYHY